MSGAFDKLSLDGMVAVVTGGSRGIGLAAAQLLRRRGAKLVVSDRSADVERLAGDDVAVFVGDVAEEVAAKATVGLARERFGRLDILVNNAGRTLNEALDETSVADWDGIMATDARGNFLHAREAIPLMLESGGGAIVAVSSVSAVIAFEKQAAYAAAKAATAQLVRVIAIEYGKRGIRANAVLPAVVETDIMDGVVEGDGRAMLRSFGDQHPIGRIGQPDEIAEVIAFLASPASSFMTGALVLADGGWTAM